MNSMEEITKDEVFEVLSSSRRRLILYHLHRRGGKAVLRELARDTAEAESDGEVDDDVVKRFYISLYQTHVPKLEEVGLVSYDSDTKTVSLTDRIEEVEGILNTESEPERRWALYYGALAVVGSAIAAAQLSGVAPASTSIVFAAALLLLAAFQYYEKEIKQREYHFLEQLVND
jgi:hypothetical protein